MAGFSLTLFCREKRYPARMELRPFTKLNDLDSRHVYFSTFEGLSDEVLAIIRDEYRDDPEGTTYSNSGGWQSRTIDYPGDGALKTIFGHLAPKSYVHYWFNINQRGASNEIHTHSYQVHGDTLWGKVRLAFCQLLGIAIQDPYWSAVYYVKTPDGNINFYRSNSIGAVLNQFGATRSFARSIWKPALSVTPKSGMLVVFHATRYHGVSQNESDDERISMALDLS